MTKLITILFALTLGVNVYAFPYKVNTASIKASEVGSTWTNFIWSMNAGSDQSFVFHTDQQGITKVALRFGITAGSTNYPLEWQSLDISLTPTGSIFQGYLSRTNLPPDRTYYAEFSGFVGTNLTSAGSIIGRGRINIQSSLFTDANYTTQIVNQITSAGTNEIDPVYLSDKSNVVALIRNWATNTAVTNVSFVTGGGLSNVNHILFNRAPSGSLQAGQIMWSAGRSSPQIQLNDNVVVDWGTTVIYVRSTESNTINKGEVVYLNGAFNDQPTVKRASNTSESLSARTIGMAAENIASNASGFVVTGGTIYNIPTTAYSAGTLLYLGANGSLVTNIPAAPLHGVFVGVVERVHANAGQIFIHVQNYQEIRELSDVNVNNVTTNDLLIWNGSVWTNYARTNLNSIYLPLAGGTMANHIFMNGFSLYDVSIVGSGTSGTNIDFDAAELNGSWTFNSQPVIAGYQTLTGTVNAANLTNLSAIGFATTSSVAALEAYTNRAANAVQRTGDVMNGSFTLDEVSTASLATNYPLVLKHRALDASAMNTLIAATTGGLRRTTTGQGSAIIWDSLNSSFATGTPLYSVSGFATGTPLYVEAAFNANSNRITLLEGYTNRAASALSSSVWALAASTTNFLQRTGGTASGVIALGESASTFNSPNYALRMNHRDVNATAIQTDITATTGGLRRATTGQSTAKIFDSSNISSGDVRVAEVDPQFTNWLASFTIGTNIAISNLLLKTEFEVADSTTNYASRIAFNSATNFLFNNNTNFISKSGGTNNVMLSALYMNNNEITGIDRLSAFTNSNAIDFGNGEFEGPWIFGLSPSIPGYINTNNLSTIAGTGLGVTSNRLVVTNVASTFEALTGNRFALGSSSITNIYSDAIGAFQAGLIEQGIISNNSIGASQLGWFSEVGIIGDGAYGASQVGLIGGTGARAEIRNAAHAANQRGHFRGTAIIGVDAIAAQQFGYLRSSSFATNNAVAAIQIIGGRTGEIYTTSSSAIGSLLLGPGTQTNAYGILANGPIQSLSGFMGNAASLTNFPSSLLTVTAGNTNYLRRTSTYPTNFNASGSFNQFATFPAGPTSMWLAVFNHHSNEWHEVLMHRVTPK